MTARMITATERALLKWTRLYLAEHPVAARGIKRCDDPQCVPCRLQGAYEADCRARKRGKSK
jgi:hypothetical protein